MKFTSRIAILIASMFLTFTAMGGIGSGGGGLGKTTRLQFTSLLLEQTELQQFTLLPSSAKDIEQETDIPEDLKFIPDDEFSDLLDVTSIYVTDDNGKVLKTFTVRRIDETPQALVFVEVTGSYE